MYKSIYYTVLYSLQCLTIDLCSVLTCILHTCVYRSTVQLFSGPICHSTKDNTQDKLLHCSYSYYIYSQLEYGFTFSSVFS